jgi:hypothetical protein
VSNIGTFPAAGSADLGGRAALEPHTIASHTKKIHLVMYLYFTRNKQNQRSILKNSMSLLELTANI